MCLEGGLEVLEVLVVLVGGVGGIVSLLLVLGDSRSHSEQLFIPVHVHSIFNYVC